MQDKKVNNQIPIVRFLYKHKWRIVLPLLFAIFYFSLPRYTRESISVQQYLFFKSSVLNKTEMVKEFSDSRERVLSDQSLKNLIYKYDLYKSEKENGTSESQIVEKLRKSINIRLDDEFNNSSGSIWILFDKANSQNIAALSDEVMSQFEQNPYIHIDKYVSEPYDPSVWKGYAFWGGLLQGLVMIVIPLIIIWEIPNIFYSSKTKEMVFSPLKSDWQNELFDAKLKRQKWKTIHINIQYSCAFLAAMMQKSPVGDLIEFVRKFAK